MKPIPDTGGRFRSLDPDRLNKVNEPVKDYANTAKHDQVFSGVSANNH